MLYSQDIVIPVCYSCSLIEVYEHLILWSYLLKTSYNTCICRIMYHIYESTGVHTLTQMCTMYLLNVMNY